MIYLPYIDEQYINRLGFSLEQFKNQGNDVYNCRCPICGDSQKSKIKARGYFYISKNGVWRYKCHNCAVNISVHSLIKTHYNHMYGEYLKDILSENRDDGYKKSHEKSDGINYDVQKEKHKLTSNLIMSEFVPIDELDDRHIAREYLNGRKIPKQMYSNLYYIDDINKISSKLEKYKNKEYYNGLQGIVIPYFSDDGLLQSVQVRDLDKNSKLRYITFNLVDDCSHIWNIENIDVNKNVYVFEGAFDAMFCDNAVAVSGSSISNKLNIIKTKCNKRVIVAFDNDYDSNTNIKKLLNKAIDNNEYIVLYDEQMNNHKDINDFALSLEYVDDLRKYISNYIRQNTLTPMQAKLKLSSKHSFSTFDIKKGIKKKKEKPFNERSM